MTTTTAPAADTATAASDQTATEAEAPAAETTSGQPDTSTDSAQAPAEGDDTDDGRTDAQIGREAARYRVRFRETEAALSEEQTARQAAEDMLTAQRQAVVDAALTASGLDPALLAAAGHTVDDFLGEDGLIDAAKLTEATSAAVARFNVSTRRGPLPNRQQGASSAGDGAATTWGALLDTAARNR